MPVATFKPVPIAPKATVPMTDTPRYKTNWIDDRVSPVNAIAQYVSGTNWPIRYYQAILSQHNDLRTIDTGTSGTYQSYNRIDNLPIKLTSSITHTHEEGTGVSRVAGSGTILSYIVPNRGDIIIADAGLNDEAFYQINQVERKTQFRETVYEVQFELLDLRTVGNERFNDLESKVLHRYHYHADRLNEGYNPIMLTDRYNAVTSIVELTSDLIRYYAKQFYHRQNATFLVPHSQFRIYDHMVVKFFKQIVSTYEAPELVQFQLINPDNSPHLELTSLYDALLEQDEGLLRQSHHRYGVISSPSLRNYLRLNSFRLTAIDQLIYPKYMKSYSGQERMAIEADDVELIKNHLWLDNSYFNTLPTIRKPIGSTGEYPLIPQLNLLESYLLPVEFYQLKSISSILERQCYRRLMKQPLDEQELMWLMESARSWGLVEQFYYIPLLILLGKAILRQ